MSIFQPSNVIKLTNVSIVRLKKGGKRFEIACYKNKVMEWRNGIEKDLDNVIQTPTIFQNVSKGQMAPKEDLEKIFKTTDEQQILINVIYIELFEILKNGELQVSSLERNNQLENLHKDVITIITEKTINPETKKPYPNTMIEKAISEIHYNLTPNKNAKQQALEIIKILSTENIIPITRAQMLVHIINSAKDYKRIKSKIQPLVSQFLSEEYDDTQCQVECLVEPGYFRELGEIIQSETRGLGKIELISLKNIDE